MFSFLFKRSPKKPPVPVAQVVAAAAKAAVETAQRATAAEAKDASIAQCAALKNDEVASADFLLACEFADVRLMAAEAIKSRPQLERVLQAMRNTDRRVVKLVQARLESIAMLESQQNKIELCLATAQRLIDEPQLAANQVAELDRCWQAIGDLSTNFEPAIANFGGLRAGLAERLRAQAALQRAVIDALAGLRRLVAVNSALDQAEISDPNEIAAKVEQLADQMALHAAAPESPSLPKHLLADFMQDYQQFQQRLAELQQRHAALAARHDVLGDWEQLPVAELKADVLKRAWHALPSLDQADLAPFQARYDALTAQLQTTRQPKEAAVTLVTDNAEQLFAEALDAMDAALQDGLLQVASEQDRALRAINLKSARPSDAQMTRLGNARAELNRLQDWAKWGGNVSREELIKAVEELPAKELPVTELAKKIGSSRERWRSLDTTSGSAPKSLWERFDAACTLAYAPAAAHFKKLAEERGQNAVKAQALLDEVAQYTQNAGVSGDDPSSVDWRALAIFSQRMSLSWQRLGSTDRKDRKRLDSQFEQAMQVLTQPLLAQRKGEIAQREQLIQSVTQLNPAERQTVDTLRGLQERWQERAKALPLDRNDEQALWQRFRSACDAVFAKRKESAEAADNERQQNLVLKEAQCAALEAALDQPETAIAKLLRETKANWLAIGQIPRAAEAASEQRYHAAVSALQAKLDAHKRAATEAQANALGQKLRLCQTVESNLVENKSTDDDWAGRWQALPALSSEAERAMRQRFDKALAASAAGDASYCSTLEKNRSALAQELLRLEIVAGIDSPPEFSRERLKLQVDVLQASLKSGRNALTPQAQLLALCCLPVLVDAPTGERLTKLLRGLVA